jgi:hypothetical protein
MEDHDGPLRHLASAECAATARSLRESCAHFDLRLVSGCDLDVMIRDLEWAGSFEGRVLSEAGAASHDRDRAFRAFLAHEQASRIAAALQQCQSVAGSPQKVRSVKKRLDRLRTQCAPAQDTLLELEIAGRLVGSWWDVSFDEPDVVLRSEGADPVAIACKRPQNRDRLRERIPEAVRQIENSGIPGIVVLGVEPIVHASRDPKRPAHFEADTPEEHWREADRLVDGLFESVAKDAAEAMTPMVCGLLMCATVTGASRNPLAFVFRWSVRRVPNLAHPSGPAVTEMVRALLNRRFRPIPAGRNG